MLLCQIAACGQQEIDPASVSDIVNHQAPCAIPSTYFGNGDEPFDGFFSDGTLVEAAFNSDDSLIWGEGTMQAEFSHFLPGDHPVVVASAGPACETADEDTP